MRFASPDDYRPRLLEIERIEQRVPPLDERVAELDAIERQALLDDDDGTAREARHERARLVEQRRMLLLKAEVKRSQLPSEAARAAARAQSQPLIEETRRLAQEIGDVQQAFVDALEVVARAAERLNELRATRGPVVAELSNLRAAYGLDVAAVAPPPPRDEKRTFLLTIYVAETAKGGPSEATLKDLAAMRAEKVAS